MDRLSREASLKAEQLLATKLYIPPVRPQLVPRSRLIHQLNEGLHQMPGVTLISAPAGFGKTTLVSEWVASPWHRPPGQVCARPAAWLSLDEGDSDITRFFTYLVAALQTIMTDIGTDVLAVFSQSQPPPIESVLTSLLNDIAVIPDPFILVLDDYHAIDSKPIDDALTFLLEHMPPQIHVVITTREDPNLPLARLRARNQLTELRVTDLRFSTAEAADLIELAWRETDRSRQSARWIGWAEALPDELPAKRLFFSLKSYWQRSFTYCSSQ